MENLKKILVYFVKNSPRMLGRTDLMKYVYTFEYYYFQMKKVNFTETKFIRYHYGPNDNSVVEATYKLQSEGILTITENPTPYGNVSYQHKCNISNLDEYSLPEDAELVACFILNRLGKESYQGVIEFAYGTPPMKAILDEEKRSGIKMNGRVLDMRQKEKVFKSTHQQKEEARARLKARKLSKCNDEEYYEHLYEQFELFEDLRRRSNLVDSSEISG